MFEFEVVEKLAVLKTYSDDCTKELRLVSWNNAKPKYDVRVWKDGKPRKGITLDNDEMKALAAALSEIQN